MMFHRWVRFGLATLLLSTAVAGCRDDPSEVADNPAGPIVTDDDSGRFFGAEPVSPYEMPDVTLEATSGRPFNLITDTGYANTIVFFGYINCEEVCPLVMSDLSSAYLRLPDDVRDRTQVLFITTDPARDTVPAIREYLARYNESFVGLTGDLNEIAEVAEAMGVAIEGKKRLPSGGYNVGHGAQVIGFHDNAAPVIWPEGTPVDVMVDDITELAGS